MAEVELLLLNVDGETEQAVDLGEKSIDEIEHIEKMISKQGIEISESENVSGGTYGYLESCYEIDQEDWILIYTIYLKKQSNE